MHWGLPRCAPIDVEGKEVKEALNKRAIEGTLGVLKACVRSKTVRRVVYTSSSSAVAWNEESEDAILDENAWSDVEFIKALKSFGTPYFISKISTERAALEFAEHHGLDLVSVIPSLIVGPFLCPSIPGSVAVALAMILGNPEVYEFIVKTSMVHIDDVASAHIFLFEYPNAKGRYICSSLDITIQELSEFLPAKYPEFRIPKPESLEGVRGYKQKGLSPKKLLDCGFKFENGLGEMFDGAIQCSKQKGLL